jgi:hypothetical protein
MVFLTDDYGRRLGRFASVKAARFELERSAPECKIVPRTDRYGRVHFIVKAPEPTFANLVLAQAFYVEEVP